MSSSSFSGDALRDAPLRVVSVSLGSSSRDHTAHAHLLGRDWILERRGVDGDLNRAGELISELDGHVAAIGLGGIDISLRAGGRQYILRDGAKLANAAKQTPVVDGSGLKNTLERATIFRLQDEGIERLRGRKVGLACAVDRFGMAEALVKVGARVWFGDFLFILGVPLPLRRLRDVRRLAALVLPVACRLPFKMLYPTGEAQTEILQSAKHQKFFVDNDVIAGDFLLLRRYLPLDGAGKTILTNTVTTADLELLRQRNFGRVITTTPEFDGRSFGTNVLEGIFAALGDRTPDDYQKRLAQLDWQPRVVNLQNTQ